MSPVDNVRKELNKNTTVKVILEQDGCSLMHQWFIVFGRVTLSNMLLQQGPDYIFTVV